jgi:hypothetical protein
MWSLGGGLAGQFLAEFLRHVEDEGFSFAVLLKKRTSQTTNSE